MSFNLSQQEKNLNAGMLGCVYTGELFFLKHNLFVAGLFAAFVLWLIIFSIKQIKLRKQNGNSVLRFDEIIAEAIRKKGNSLILLSPITCGILVFLGHLSQGPYGIKVGLIASSIYIIFVFLAERYPVVPFWSNNDL